MFGLLNLNKPARVSSAGILGRIKHLVRPAKIGHAGTLDPLASGVLVACIGPATRLVEYVQRMPKSYRATFLLGRSSPSDDVERDVTELVDPPIPSREAVERAAGAFVGAIQQRPPKFSAVKVEGRRAYALARKGRDVELQPREVMIHRLITLDYDYPTLVLEIDCGSGTYVRALGRDLAESLGTAAVMSALERTAIGTFRVEEACEPSVLTVESLPRFLISPLHAVATLPKIQLSDAEIQRVINGLIVPPRDAAVAAGGWGKAAAAHPSDATTGARFALPQPPDANVARASEEQEFAAVNDAGELISIVRRRSDRGLAPVMNFRKADVR